MLPFLALVPHDGAQPINAEQRGHAQAPGRTAKPIATSLPRPARRMRALAHSAFEPEEDLVKPSIASFAASLAALALHAPALATTGATAPTAANQEAFCAGFAKGARAVSEERLKTAICPPAHAVPIGSTAYREGIKAGLRAAGKNDK